MNLSYTVTKEEL